MQFLCRVAAVHFRLPSASPCFVQPVPLVLRHPYAMAHVESTSEQPAATRPPRRRYNRRRNAPPATVAASAAAPDGEAPPTGNDAAPAAPRPRGRRRGGRGRAAVPVAADAAQPSEAAPQRPARGPRTKPSATRGARRAKKPVDPDMRRLFVALALPDTVRAKLKALPLAPLRHELNLAATETLHVTLHFLGLAPLSKVERALAGVRARPLRIAVTGIGAFPRPDAARVLWAGVREIEGDTQPEAVADGAGGGDLHASGNGAGEGLTRLFGEVEKAIRSTGVEIDARGYHPHVTVAKLKGSGRRKRLTPGIADFVSDHSALDAGELDVTEFVLYESVLLDGGGSEYKVLRRYALDGEGIEAGEKCDDGRGDGDGDGDAQ